MEPSTVFSSQDVAKLTGVSLRQLQWWDEQKVVSPIQRSHRRLYSRFQVIQVSLIVNLRRKGISLQKTRGVLEKFKDFVSDNGNRLVNARAPLAELYLITDGKHVELADSPQAIVKVLLDQTKPIVGVCVSDLVDQIDSSGAGPKPVRRETRSAASGPRRVQKAS